MTSDSSIKTGLKPVDPVWHQIRQEAEALAADEPFMASLAHSVVLHHNTLEAALSYRLAQKLSSPEMSPLLMREMADAAYARDPKMGAAARADIMAVYDRDPACNRMLQPLWSNEHIERVEIFYNEHLMHAMHEVPGLVKYTALIVMVIGTLFTWLVGRWPARGML